MSRIIRPTLFQCYVNQIVLRGPTTEIVSTIYAICTNVKSGLLFSVVMVTERNIEKICGKQTQRNEKKKQITSKLLFSVKYTMPH